MCVCVDIMLSINVTSVCNRDKMEFKDHLERTEKTVILETLAILDLLVLLEIRLACTNIHNTTQLELSSLNPLVKGPQGIQGPPGDIGPPGPPVSFV